MLAAQTPSQDLKRREETAATVYSVVREVCAMNGVLDLDVNETTVPFGIEDFDSITSVEVVVQICHQLKIKLPNNPFLPRADTPAQSLGQVISAIHAIHQGSKQ